jgi:hypothetical protein
MPQKSLSRKRRPRHLARERAVLVSGKDGEAALFANMAMEQDAIGAHGTGLAEFPPALQPTQKVPGLWVI